MKIINKDLILKKDTTFNESIRVIGDIKGNYNLIVKGNVKANDIVVWNIEAEDIEARGIKADNIKAKKVRAWDIEANDIVVWKYYSVGYCSK